MEVVKGASSKVRASSAKLGAETNLKSMSPFGGRVLLPGESSAGPGDKDIDVLFGVFLALHKDLDCLSS